MAAEAQQQPPPPSPVTAHSLVLAFRHRGLHGLDLRQGCHHHRQKRATGLVEGVALQPFQNIPTTQRQHLDGLLEAHRRARAGSQSLLGQLS